MSTSLRIDAEEWIPGALLIGDIGGGVLGSSIPATGDDGSAYAYNDLVLPDDAGKEICGRITSWPVGLTEFTVFEDTSFVAAGPNGTYSFVYDLYVDYVNVGSATAMVLIGALSGDMASTQAPGTSNIVGGSSITGEMAATQQPNVFTAVNSFHFGAIVATQAANTASIAGGGVVSGGAIAATAAKGSASIFGNVSNQVPLVSDPLYHVHPKKRHYKAKAHANDE